MTPTFEKDLRASMAGKLRKSGHRVFTLTPGMGIPSGTPDLLIWLKLPDNGVKVAFIEVKRPGGRLSPIQKVVTAGWRSFGVPVYVLHNLSELKEAIKELGAEL